MANTRSLEAKVVRLARKLGYASAKYLKVWRGYDVYRAFDDESMADVESPMDGPTFILDTVLKKCVSSKVLIFV